MEALAQLREQTPELEKLGLQLACIVQGDAQEAAEFCGQYGMAAQCIPDPQKETYRKFGLDRASWGSLLFPSPELKKRRKENREAGFGVSLKGSLKSHCDILLLPGAAVVERGGRILWLHRGKNPADLPAAEIMVEQARKSLATQ
jgi:AhpC/TSA antioxidant enzyme